MVEIKKQVLASMGLDKDGESLPREAIERLFETMKVPMNLGINHDPTKPYIGKITQKYLEEIRPGVLAVLGDVEVYDEKAIEMLKKGGGFSAGFTRPHSKKVEAPFIVYYDPRIFDPKEFSDNEDVTYTPFSQKSAEVVLLLTIGFISGNILGGFFKEAGKDLYTKFRTDLLSLIRKKEEEKSVNIKICHVDHINMPHGEVKVSMQLDKLTLDYLNKNSIDIDKIFEEAKAICEDRKSTHILISFLNGNPQIEIS